MTAVNYLAQLAAELGIDVAELRWMDKARCAETDPEAFFPEKGGSAQPAKAICAICEVRAECLDYALEHDERFGVWGGLCDYQRRGIRRAAA